MSDRTLIGWLLDGLQQAPPDKLAVSSSEGALSYGDLFRGAQGIAATLRDAGIGRGDRVGLWVDKTPKVVQSILGILLSGAAYVPLDPRAPWRRTRTIVQNCELAALFVDGPRLPMLREVLSGQSIRLLLVDETSDSSRGPPDGLPGEIRTERLATAIAHHGCVSPMSDPQDVSYLLYTSGSTGTPKGVVHTHASGQAFAAWVRDQFDIQASDVFSSHAPFHFDLSIADLFTTLGSGASVRLLSATEAMLAPYLVRKIPEWNISVWYSVPSILVNMLDGGGLEAQGLPTIRTLLFAGEVFPIAQLRRLRRALPHARLYNLFGPTETNVCTFFEVPSMLPDGESAIPIGRACPGMETFVLDEHGQTLPAGGTGILWARGAHVMREYWRAPEQTAERLRPDPRGLPGVAFCTGDRVRERSDGHYEFLGRADHQVKVRGYRVELGEIESVLNAHPAILEAVVVAVPDGAGQRLVAVVVGRAGALLDEAGLRAHCRHFLPLYMVPDAIHVRQTLPRTSTGKTDRVALQSEYAPDLREAS